MPGQAPWLVLGLNLPAIVTAIALYIWLGLTEVALILAVVVTAPIAVFIEQGGVIEVRVRRHRQRKDAGLALEADAGRVGHAHAAILDRAVVGEAAEWREDLRVGFVAAALQADDEF